MNTFVFWSEHLDSCMWSGSERGKDWREGISVLNSQTRKYLFLDWNYWNSLLSKTHLKTFSPLSPSIEGCCAVIESHAAAGWEGNWRWGPSAQGCWWQHQGKADWEQHLSAPGAYSPDRLPSSSAWPQLVTALPWQAFSGSWHGLQGTGFAWEISIRILSFPSLFLRRYFIKTNLKWSSQASICFLASFN